jgi:hypothetical protein
VNRTTGRALVPILGVPLAVLLMTLMALAGPVAAAAPGTVPPSTSPPATVPTDASPDDAVPTGSTVPGSTPTGTANDFLPENADITTCVGVLERPGCGSESRGGWRQLLVFVLLGGALALVFGKVAVEVRRSRQRLEPDGRPDGAGADATEIEDDVEEDAGQRAGGGAVPPTAPG